MAVIVKSGCFSAFGAVCIGFLASLLRSKMRFFQGMQCYCLILLVNFGVDAYGGCSFHRQSLLKKRAWKWF